MAGLAKPLTGGMDVSRATTAQGLALVPHRLKHGVWRAQTLRPCPPSEEIAKRHAGATGKGHFALRIQSTQTSRASNAALRAIQTKATM
jgi:hypothetical protein